MYCKKKVLTVEITLIILLSLLIALSGCQSSAEDALKVTLLKIGKADAIVVQAETKTMVIDTGEEDDGAELVSFLKDQGCTRVDTLIITHFDKDHVGGADTLVESLEIGQVLLPDYQGTSTEYQEFISTLVERDIVPQRLTASLEFSLGGASVLVEPPSSYIAENDTDDVDNDFSLITTITYGENRLLFTGDAEEQRFREWLSGENAQNCNFIKMPHHGKYDEALETLLETVKPEYAVICSSAKNPADQETLNLLEQHQIFTFQTKDGNITALSNGKQLEVSQEKK